jgi:hypothetical protein
VLQTEDLYLSALLLERGGELVRIEIRGTNGRRLAFFHIAGPDLEQVERDYLRGPVAVNLRLLKAEVTRLKNMAFDALRQEESRCNRSASRASRY